MSAHQPITAAPASRLAADLACLDAICGSASEAIERTRRIVDRVLPQPSYANWHWCDPVGSMDRSRRFGERNELARLIRPRIAAKIAARRARAGQMTASEGYATWLSDHAPGSYVPAIGGQS